MHPFDAYRSAYVLGAHFPKLDAIPSIHADFGPYLSFDLNYAAIWAITTELYYLIITPAVTVSRNPSTITERTKRSDHPPLLSHSLPTFRSQRSLC